jgi:peptidoglycan hydrolase-like protein with peptidoglycan-binding domain
MRRIMKTYVLAICALMFMCSIAGSPALARSSDQMVYKAQLGLKGAGFDPGPADGIMGRRTTLAVMEFQRNHGLPVTGRLDRETLNKIEPFAGPQGRSKAGGRHKGQGKGMSAARCDRGVFKAQNRLQKHGYHPGPADGMMGKRTCHAVKQFQRDYGLPVTGRIDSETLKRLEGRPAPR